MANFVDFTVKASSNPSLGKEFVDTLAKATPEALTKWFSGKGFTVSSDESKKLVEGKDNIISSNGVKGY